MRIITINENQEMTLMHFILNEMYGGLSDKVAIVKDYLDKHFSRATATVFNDEGHPEIKPVVAWLDDYKQVIKTLTDVQLFYIIQDKFKNIMSDNDERDSFLKQVIKDWYNNKISRYNTLTAY